MPGTYADALSIALVDRWITSLLLTRFPINRVIGFRWWGAHRAGESHEEGKK